MAKRKPTTKRKSKTKTTQARTTKAKTTRARTAKRVSGSGDTKARRKHSRGGRIEAYTLGEALGGKNWP